MGLNAGSGTISDKRLSAPLPKVILPPAGQAPRLPEGKIPGAQDALMRGNSPRGSTRLSQPKPGAGYSAAANCPARSRARKTRIEADAAEAQRDCPGAQNPHELFTKYSGNPGRNRGQKSGFALYFF